MNYIKTLKIKKNILSDFYVLFIFCLLFPHFEPGYFNDIGGIVDSFYNIWRIISAFIILLLYLKNKKTSYLFISFSILWIYYFLNTTLKNGFSAGEMVRILSYLIVAMIIEYYVKKQAKALVCALLFLYEFLVVANFITILLFPKGMYITEWQWENYFLGFRNSFIIYFIPCITFEIIWAKFIGKWCRAIVMLILCIISAVLSASATCFLITISYVFLFITGIYRYKIFNIISCVFFYLITFFAVIVFRLQSLLAPLFAALGRNITMTGRTIIWDYTIQKIIQHPLTGYGKQSAEYRMSQLPNVYAASHAHNFLLEHLYCGGFIQFILLIIWFVFLCKNLLKDRYLDYTHIIMIGIITFLFMMLVEIGWDAGIYGFFILAGYSKQLTVQMPVAKKRKRVIVQTKKATV